MSNKSKEKIIMKRENKISYFTAQEMFNMNRKVCNLT